MSPGGAADHAPRILALGDAAVMLELGNAVDLDVNAIAQRAAAELRAAGIPGVTDVVAAIATVAVFFDAPSGQAGDLRRTVTERLGAAYAHASAATADDVHRRIEIPVCYEAAYGVDLPDVAQAVGMSVDDVVRRHVASTHRVLMMGFAPGFPYLGGLDAALVIPRRASPRPRVEAGSVAIAAGQTAIYPCVSPGGWNLIGRTPLVMFDPAREPASLLQAGDEVVFVPIDAATFERLVKAGTSP